MYNTCGEHSKHDSNCRPGQNHRIQTNSKYPKLSDAVHRSPYVGKWWMGEAEKYWIELESIRELKIGRWHRSIYLSIHCEYYYNVLLALSNYNICPENSLQLLKVCYQWGFCLPYEAPTKWLAIFTIGDLNGGSNFGTFRS